MQNWKDRFPKIDIVTDDPISTVLSIEKDKPEEETKKTIAGQYLKRLERIKKGPSCKMGKERTKKGFRCPKWWPSGNQETKRYNN